MHKEYRVGVDIPFTWDYYTYNVQDIPSSATVTVYNSAGTALVTNAAATIASDGTVSYTLSSSYVTEGRNFKIVLTYVLSGTTNYTQYLYDVVKYPLRCEVSDNDLFLYLGDLRDKVKERTAETSAAGGTTYLISSALTTDNRTWKGGNVDIYIQTSNTATVTHSAKITNYAGGTVTFTPAYTSTIAANTVFSIRPSFYTLIENAFNNFVIRDIRNKVSYTQDQYTGVAGGYIDNTVVNTLVIYKTLEMYCFSQIESENDKWDVRYKVFLKNYSDELEKLKEPFDSDNDGNISDAEDANRPSFINVGLRR